jgi:hypothetical protein
MLNFPLQYPQALDNIQLEFIYHIREHAFRSFSFMPSTILVTLGGPLRLVLDNFVKGLPLQNTARELIGDFTTISSSLPVSFRVVCDC